MQGKHPGAFFEMKPGYYTEDQLGLASFDVPMTIGRIFVLHEKRLYLPGGATSSFLRGKFPVLPLFGVIWQPRENLRFMGIVPEPRIIYSPAPQLDLRIGGELVGGSFRTDHDADIMPRKLGGTQVDYSDYRAGAGIIYTSRDGVSFEIGAGYSNRAFVRFQPRGRRLPHRSGAVFSSRYQGQVLSRNDAVGTAAGSSPRSCDALVRRKCRRRPRRHDLRIAEWCWRASRAAGAPRTPSATRASQLRGLSSMKFESGLAPPCISSLPDMNAAHARHPGDPL